MRCFCLCVTGFETLCTRYHPRDSVIACRPCVMIVLRGTLAWTPTNICDLASVLPVSRTTDHLSIEISLYFGILSQSFMDHNVEDHSINHRG